MPPTSQKNRRPKYSYPYQIPSVTIPELPILKQLSPHALWAFLRVEALLRSQRTMEWYKKWLQAPSQDLGEKNKNGEWPIITWTPEITPDDFNGAHHKYLDPSIPSNTYIANHGVRDIRKDLKQAINNGHIKEFLEGFLADPHCLLLRIDGTFAPTPNTRKVKELLSQINVDLKTKGKKHDVLNDKLFLLWRKMAQLQEEMTSCNDVDKLKKLRVKFRAKRIQSNKMTREVRELRATMGNHFWFEEARRLTPQSFQDYYQALRCYDLQINQIEPKRTLEEIADIVYGEATVSRYQKVDTAITRATVLIQCAEQQDWPPPKIAMQKQRAPYRP